MNNFKTILLFGGTSEERRVSVATAQNVASVLENAEFWFMNASGKIAKVSKEELLGHKNPFTVDFVPSNATLIDTFEIAVKDLKPTETVFYFGLHGGEGENGNLQSILEKKHIPFTGSGSSSSHRAFEKGISREEAHKQGVLIATGLEFYTTDNKLETLLTDRLKEFGPQVLKPVDAGSSFGLFFLNHVKEVEGICQKLRDLGKRRYLTETLIVGRELTVGVIHDGNGNKALPPSEVILEKNRSFDFEGKYLGKGTQEITPADLNKEEEKKCQALAVKMHEALGCYGYSRTDMILTNEGPYFLETNTLPGLTKASFIPQQLEAAKISFKKFIERQLELAVKRYC